MQRYKAYSALTNLLAVYLGRVGPWRKGDPRERGRGKVKGGMP